ncbi:hypothetical protein CYMTET_49584 [Cymbomonas tetramitiformis]|uniref:Uncharacterized protein n=1 Tax=Cymbomonas tetramitiformis TaxID=36881 RepID=A0AAE0BPV5_9CHLO|nr:hypothetical protein CYMTET_49584 [Cymbomonas tetramitiformis]
MAQRFQEALHAGDGDMCPALSFMIGKPELYSAAPRRHAHSRRAKMTAQTTWASTQHTASRRAWVASRWAVRRRWRHSRLSTLITRNGRPTAPLDPAAEPVVPHGRPLYPVSPLDAHLEPPLTFADMVGFTVPAQDPEPQLNLVNYINAEPDVDTVSVDSGSVDSNTSCYGVAVPAVRQRYAVGAGGMSPLLKHSLISACIYALFCVCATATPLTGQALGGATDTAALRLHLNRRAAVFLHLDIYIWTLVL